MSDAANRILWSLVGLVLLAMGGVGLSFGLGAWGASAAHAHIVTSTLVGRWRQGGDASYAVAGAIGFILVLLGLGLARSQLRRSGGPRLTDFRVGGPSGADAQARGRTMVRATSLSHAVEADLERIDGVERALVGLYGTPDHLELRARLDVSDSSDLDAIARSVDGSLGRLHTTAGLRPRAVDVTVAMVGNGPGRVR